MKDKDVTADVRFGNPDDELLPLARCVCGATFGSWEFCLSIYEDDPRECEHCHRKLYFRNGVRVFEVVESAPASEAVDPHVGDTTS